MKAIYSEEMIELMRRHYSRLTEKDKRQYAGLEALKIGRGGTNYICTVLRIGRNNVIRGKRELLSDPNEFLPANRQRLPGGGRKKNGKIS